MSDRDDRDEDAVPGLDAQGRPDPAYAASLGLVPASPLRRSLAFAIDATIWVALATPGIIGAGMLLPLLSAKDATPSGILADPRFPLAIILTLASQALLVVFGLVQLVLHGMRGVTVGKASAGVRSVNVATFAKPGFWRVVLRVLVLAGAQLVLPLIGPAVLFSSSLWDAEQRGRSWLDRIGRTWVVRTRGSLDPFDARAMRQATRALNSPVLAAAAPLPSLATGAGAGAFTPGPRFNGGVITAGGADAAADDWLPPALVPAADPARPAPGAPVASVPTPPAPPSPPAPQAAPAPLPTPAAHPPAPATAPTRATPAPAPSAPARPAPAFIEDSAPVPAYALSTLGATLLFDDGSSIRVSGDGLLGRKPEARAGEDIRHLIPVDDPSMQISKTHAVFGVDRQGFWVTDRGSTNGTRVVIGGEPRELVAGERARVPWGSTVLIGGRRFSVAPAKGDA